MEISQKILSNCGNYRIDVIKSDEGSYLLHKFVREYDSEEEKYYEIRSLPDPPGRFGDLDIAVKEAIHLLSLHT